MFPLARSARSHILLDEQELNECAKSLTPFQNEVSIFAAMHDTSVHSFKNLISFPKTAFFVMFFEKCS